LRRGIKREGVFDANYAKLRNAVPPLIQRQRSSGSRATKLKNGRVCAAGERLAAGSVALYPMKIRYLAFTLLGLIAPTLALASSTVSQAFSFSGSWSGAQYDLNGTLISAGNYTGGSTNNFSYSLFDTSLGTLNSVELCVHSSGSGDSMIDYYNWSGATNLPTITVTNNQGLGYSLTGGHNGWLDGGFAPLVNSQSIFGTQTATVSTTTSPGTWIMSPNDYSSANFNQTQSFNASTHLSDWIGAGSASATYQNYLYALASYSATPPGGTGVTGDGAINTHWESETWSTQVTIKYNYTAVPEPASGLVVMLGMTLFGLRRRR
jgi:hypothetical protein